MSVVTDVTSSSKEGFDPAPGLLICGNGIGRPPNLDERSGTKPARNDPTGQGNDARGVLSIRGKRPQATDFLAIYAGQQTDPAVGLDVLA
jgi:hypothetical protein